MSRSISFCTTTFNRLEHLSKTLPYNIRDNRLYSKLELVILDCGSKDDTHKFMRQFENLMEVGKLSYYKLLWPEIEFFDAARMKNICHKLANGELLCNLDVDQYSTKGFARKLNILCKHKKDKFIISKNGKLWGKLAVLKKDFIKMLGGYDESMDGYWSDDEDLFNRAIAQDFEPIRFNNGFKMIHHDRSSKYFTYDHDNKTKNRIISNKNILDHRYKANIDRQWGCGVLLKNFREEIKI